jgi:hypothetical protein
MIRLGSLTIDLLSYWRCGTGEGRSAMLDATCLRDTSGHPYVPGRHLRGLLRDAFRDLETLGADGFDGQAVRLFGEDGFVGDRQSDELTPRLKTRPGLIWIESAVLPEETHRWIVARPGASAELFRTTRSTAIEPGTGAAAEQSLRAEEVAIPLSLAAPIGLVSEADPADAKKISKLIAEACLLLRSLGAKRARGLGRCCVTLEAA